MRFQPILNDSEVIALFAQPLIQFLSSKNPYPDALASEPYYEFEDVDWGESKVRYHRFVCSVGWPVSL